MAESATLFVTAKPELANVIYDKVAKQISKWQRSLLDVHWKNNTTYTSRLQFLFKTDHKDWSNGVYNIHTHDFRSFNMNFRVQGEERSLFCTHDCSNDYSDTYKGDKIIFSLNNWGMSDFIMKVIAKSLKEFGDVYYDHNDCDTEDFIKL